MVHQNHESEKFSNFEDGGVHRKGGMGASAPIIIYEANIIS